MQSSRRQPGSAFAAATRTPEPPRAGGGFTLIELPIDKLKATQSRAFTLIELLVVISIISLLISILLPALGSATRQAHRLSCLSNIRQTGMGLFAYTTDHNEGLLATRFNIASGSVLAPDNSTIVSPGIQGGAWLDELYVNYTGSNTHVFECPDQKPLSDGSLYGFGLNEFVIHYESAYGSYVDQGDRPHRIGEFLRPSDKLWLGETGMRNSFTDPLTQFQYGTYIRDLGSANRDWQTGISGRHEMGMNIFFFDGHADYGRYDDYVLVNSSYTGITGVNRSLHYSPTGRVQARDVGCADH